jgi:hypothetical protein
MVYKGAQGYPHREPPGNAVATLGERFRAQCPASDDRLDHLRRCGFSVPSYVTIAQEAGADTVELEVVVALGPRGTDEELHTAVVTDRSIRLGVHCSDRGLLYGEL